MQSGSDDEPKGRLLKAADMRAVTQEQTVWSMTRFYILAMSVGMFSAGCGPMHVAVGIGGPPVCPYGYYEVPP